MRTVPALLVVMTLLSATASRADESPPPERHHTTAPWVVVGVGAGVAAIGVLSFVGAAKAQSDVASESAAKGCTTNPVVVCPTGIDGSNIKTNLDGEHAMNVLGAIFTAVGGAALIAGLVWHFVEPSGPRGLALVIAPALGPGYGGVGVAARF